MKNYRIRKKYKNKLKPNKQTKLDEDFASSQILKDILNYIYQQ